ncbi:MAG: PEP-CTERM sorting domain-containing protein [Planctomycetes bacterium]|nr:PEP-CTERM sorting domain-containing protein [Planctomycetota bacterium]
MIDVCFLSADPALGAYKAEFLAATDFGDAIAGATYQYWRLDPHGSRFHNGNLYSSQDESLVDWSAVPETATFDGAPASGYIMESTVVPEPATLALVAAGTACTLLRRRGQVAARWRSQGALQIGLQTSLPRASSAAWSPG